MQPSSFARKVRAAKRSLEEMDEGVGQGRVSHKERRLAMLDQLLWEEQTENRLQDPYIFLSFAGDEGQNLIQEIKPALSKLRIPGGVGTFHVETGMTVRGKPNVLDHVTEKMAPCCIFFGIMTKEYPLAVKDDEGGDFAPGAWVLLEAGIARGLGLEIVFFVEKGVYGSFWKGAFGHVRQAIFDRSNYRPGLSLACELVLEHYGELKMKGV